MLATRLTVLRPALRTLLRPKTTKAKDMVDPTTTSAWWKEWAGQNHQGFFNVGAAFFLTVLASQNYSGRLERAALQADLAAAQNEAAALREEQAEGPLAHMVRATAENAAAAATRFTRSKMRDNRRKEFTKEAKAFAPTKASANMAALSAAAFHAAGIAPDTTLTTRRWPLRQWS